MTYMESLLFALSYFTNLPVPGNPKWSDENAAASLAWLPLTGLAVGLCLLAFGLFCVSTGFPQYLPLRALLIMAIELWVGGAAFIEGFGKTCDGVFSGLSGKRGVELTRDSAPGRKSVLGLIFILIAKLALLGELSYREEFVFVVLFYPCWARWAYSFAACNYQVANPEGMAYFFKISQKPIYIIMSSAFTVLTLMLMPSYFYIGALASFGVVVICCSMVQSKLGGLNEENYGLAAVVAELSFLLFCSASGYFTFYMGR